MGTFTTTVKYGKLNPEEILKTFPKGIQKYVNEVKDLLDEVIVTPHNISLESKDFDGEYSLMWIKKGEKGFKAIEQIVKQQENGKWEEDKIIADKDIGENPTFKEIQDIFNYP